MKVYHKIVVLFSVFIMGLSVFTIILFGIKKPKLTNDGIFLPVSIVGQISMDNGPFTPLQPDALFDMDHCHHYHIQGHFTQDIEKNHQIMLRISDLRVRIAINGEEVFSFGEDWLHSSGNVWHSFTSPGITKQDVVDISLYNFYTRVHPLSINQFLSELHYGSMDGLYKMVLRKNGLSLLMGLLIVVIGLCEGVIGLVCLIGRQNGADRILFSSGFAIFSGIWFSIHFNIICLVFPYPAAVATADVLSAYLMSAFFALYISTYLTGKLKLCGWIDATVILIYTTACLTLILFFEVDAYRTIFFGWILAVLDLLVSLICLAVEYVKRPNRAIRIFLLSLIPIFLGTLLDAIGYWTELVNETTWLRGCFLIFVLIQIQTIATQFRENREKAEKVENELIQNRISIMLSQIQPHFLYNALTAISQLCDIDSQKAKEAIIGFSTYLRGNLDALSQKSLVPFEKELDHIQVYLSLEKMRFDDMLTVVYDIQVHDFLVPALTVQPVVENAVRYGVTRRKEGGTIKIATKATENAYLVIVSDNGNGFDKNANETDHKSHIGIENVKSRLMAQCGGFLTIKSTIGSGTTAVITIPKGEKSDEHCRN